MNGPQATRNADGKLCVLKEEMVQSVVKEPILKCTLKNVEKCHYTYITQFTPIREEVNIICRDVGTRDSLGAWGPSQILQY